MDENQQNPSTTQTNQSTPAKIYLGNLQEKVRKSNDRFLVGTICLDDIDNIPEEHIFKFRNGKRFAKIIVNPFKDGANQYGNTHSIAIDTYKPQTPQG